MSRSNYSDDCENWEMICWRGAVASATKGKRGQTLFREMIAALDAMPEKKLIASELVDSGGGVCALGCLGKARGVKMDDLDPCESKIISERFNIADALAREIAYENDEGGFQRRETPEQRWMRMREWVSKQIISK